MTDPEKPVDDEEDRFIVKQNVLEEWDVFYRSRKFFSHPRETYARDWAETAQAHGMDTAHRVFKAKELPKYDPAKTPWRENWAGLWNIGAFIVGGYCVWYGLLNEPHDNWHAVSFIFGISVLADSIRRWFMWDKDCSTKKDLSDPRHDWRAASYIYEDKKTGDFKTRLICIKCHREDII